MATTIRIDRLAAAREAAGILLKAQRELPAPVATAYFNAGLAWATLAMAIGDTTIEIDMGELTDVNWSWT